MKNEIKSNLDQFLKEEQQYFDDLASVRTRRGIPCEADMRTDTYYEPKNIDEELIDSKLKEILLNPHRKNALDSLYNAPDGVILDVCCGPGWFCLEGARNGRQMIGYDISEEALKLAQTVYEQKKQNEQITGQINYTRKSVETADFSSEKISGVMGWSAFHHLSKPGEFLDLMYEQMEIGGIIVTMDDLDSDRNSKIIKYILKFIFPIYEYTYFEKLKFVFNILIGKKRVNTMQHSPMEVYADKHGEAAEVIRHKLTQRFMPIYDEEFGAFSIYVCHSLKGPKWWRHTLSKIIVKFDRQLIKMKICKGSYRIIVSKKT